MDYRKFIKQIFIQLLTKTRNENVCPIYHFKYLKNVFKKKRTSLTIQNNEDSPWKTFLKFLLPY